MKKSENYENFTKTNQKVRKQLFLKNSEITKMILKIMKIS